MRMAKQKTLKDWKRKLERCNKYYQSHGYYYNSNPKKKGGKSINCCGFPFRALYHFGVIPKECIYAYTYHGRLKGQGAAIIKQKCDYIIVDMPFYKAVKLGLVKPGDIIGYKNGAHTEVYKGVCVKNGKKYFKFYNYGPKFRQTNGVSYRSMKYDRPVGCVIRIKNLDRKSKAKPVVKQPAKPKATETMVRSELVKTAWSYKGAQQGSSKHKQLVDTFNKVKPDGWAMTYSAPWCACAASAWALKAFDKILAKEYFPLSANCGTIIERAKKMGIWRESDAYKPKPGDWILYDWDDSGKGDNHGSPDHVGIVEKVDGKTIYVIEGNMGTKSIVGVREIYIDGRFIRGYVVPKYAALAKRFK